MKSRRENGATLVSPMTSDVCMGSALMMDFLWRVWWLRSSPDPCSKPARESFGQSARTKATLESSISRVFLNPNLAKESDAARRVSGNRIQQAIAAERKSPACEDAVGTGTEARRGRAILPAKILPPRKEQGRQRSIPQTALPAPDIEIGLRRPVDAIMPRFQSGHM